MSKFVKRLVLCAIGASLLLCPAGSVRSQTSTASAILAARKAELVLVCKPSTILRMTAPDAAAGSGDYSQVSFRIVDVLKGDYEERTINMLFPAHVDLDSGTEWIVIADDDTGLLSAAEKRTIGPRLSGKTKFYVGSPAWVFEATEDESKAIRTWIDCGG